MSAPDILPVEFVTGQILKRYSHPSRAAFLYAFRLRMLTASGPLIPNADQIMAAWLDEGEGLTEVPFEEGLARCQVARDFKPGPALDAHARRQRMARILVFSVEQQAADQVVVELLSRALLFTPKGDRRVTEIWRPVSGGGWYSAPVDRER